MVVEPCPECNTHGEVGSGYGGYHAYTCPDCGHEWVADGATSRKKKTPDDVPPDDGSPDNMPTKVPDGELRLTDDGLELPSFLKGYIGSFTIRTAATTADFETSMSGLPDRTFYNGIIAAYPCDGEFHGDLREGLMAISTEKHPETIYEIIDKREVKR